MYAHGFMHQGFYLVIFIIFLLIFIPIFSKKRKNKEKNLDIIKKRYAKGEINKQEYEELKKELSSYKK
ncbi:hypothetical protein CP960_00770 [Malaciobacter halophilus]|uniref:SHOCT domain-containing protein n=1 Tax=Malaciobacter halophilus TaxID=197482 RepID=A0A2N1J6G0_9BACT|nr:SHOCT domain-containing protein [Malaciobacter halophilus]AXH09356.1 hypothetical protein AHALO_0973 [Malaciobacter halophilus]PKI82131.1 hypothetical protein CP960_00770 [Malaciobacter halophilus]